MNDRYLFKAKGKNWQELPKDEQWVTGTIMYIENKCMMLIEDEENLLRVHYLDDEMWSADIYAIEVDESTICQCTGLKDKNGKLIWENDIVRDKKGNCYKAFWQNNYYQFSWICVKSEIFLIGAKWDLWSIKSYEIEVIGNRFDNPELLESEE